MSKFISKISLPVIVLVGMLINMNSLVMANEDSGEICQGLNFPVTTFDWDTQKLVKIQDCQGWGNPSLLDAARAPVVIVGGVVVAVYAGGKWVYNHALHPAVVAVNSWANKHCIGWGYSSKYPQCDNSVQGLGPSDSE